MRFAKALALLKYAVIWVVVGLPLLYFTMPFWGMSADPPFPWFLPAMLAIWLASYAAIALAVIRSKERN